VDFLFCENAPLKQDTLGLRIIYALFTQFGEGGQILKAAPPSKLRYFA
jgi:hypothetical protein